jgi:hypothetical protein
VFIANKKYPPSFKNKDTSEEKVEMGNRVSPETKEKAKAFVSETTSTCYLPVNQQRGAASFSINDINREIERAKVLGFPKFTDVEPVGRKVKQRHIKPDQILNKQEYCELVGDYYSKVVADAIKNKNTAQLEILASINIPQIYAKLLDFALERGERKLAVEIIKTKFYPDDLGGCALCVLVRRGDPQLIDMYFENKVSRKLNQQILDESLAYAVERAGQEVKALREGKLSPRNRASQETKVANAREIVRTLLEHNANPGAETSIRNPSKYSPYTLTTLMRSVVNDDLESTKLLLGSGRVADVEKGGTSEELPSPLWVAVDNGNPEMANLLLSYKANPDRKTQRGSPFELSRQKKDTAINKIFGQWEAEKNKATGRRPSVKAPVAPKKETAKKAAPKRPPPALRKPKAETPVE